MAAEPVSTTSLVAEGLNQAYGGSHILRNVSFAATAGEVTVLLGRNGVGKSTLLRTLMGIHPLLSGRLRLGTDDLTQMSTNKRAIAGMAYVPQGREIFPRLTVEENLRMGLATGRLPGIPAMIYELFPVLAEMRSRRGGDLSGGQQQQLAIGRALCMQPKVLLLDEPTEGIQPSVIKDIGRVIRKLAERGDLAIVLVEQYYDFARDVADAYLVMERGEIIRRGLGRNLDADGVRQLVAV